MHRARHHNALPAVKKHRALILLVVAAMGLGLALYLPTRADRASATENSAQWPDRRWHHHHDWDRNRGPSPSPSDSDTPSPAPSEMSPSPSYSEESPSPSDDSPSPSEASPSPSDTPASPSPSPSPSETTPSPAPPTSTAPEVTKWAPFTNYTAGQLVKFGKITYQVQQMHTALPGWEPPKLPQLFKVF